MVSTIIEALLPSLESLLFLLLFAHLNGLNNFITNNKLKVSIFVVIYTLVLNWPSLYIPYGAFTVFVILFSSILLCMISGLGFFSVLISIAAVSVLVFFVEAPLSMALMFFFNLNVDLLSAPGPTRSLIGLILKLFELLLAFIVIKTKFGQGKLVGLVRPGSLYSLLIFQSFMVSIFMFTASTFLYKNNIRRAYDLIIPIIYLLFMILVFLDFKERDKLQKVQYKVNAQEEYIMNLETIMNIIRREKHDFSNHLNTLLAIGVLNRTDAIEKIKSYIFKISTNLNTAYNIYNTGNDFVDGLLAVKSNIAFEHNIKFEVDIDVPMERFSVNDCDLTSILSNLLDNAFDAITSTDHAEGKFIEVCSYAETGYIYLSVTNNGPKINDNDLSKIFENGYSTKHLTKGDRGFGLYIIKLLIVRNSGEIQVLSSDEQTEFVIKFKDVKK